MTTDNKPPAGPSEPQLVVYEQNTCTTCRHLATLQRERGVDYKAIEYHITGLAEPEIRGLLQKLGARPRALARWDDRAGLGAGLLARCGRTRRHLLGSRLQRRIPETSIRKLLGLIACVIAVRYIQEGIQPAPAQRPAAVTH